MSQKQKQEQDDTMLKERDPVPAPPPQEIKRADHVDADEMDRMRLTDPLFIEKTRPEDPSGRPGQRTRDNVNPAIPSAEPGAEPNSGGIVDAKSLGMDQGGGVEPKYPPVRKRVDEQDRDGLPPTDQGAPKDAPVQTAEGELPPGHGNASINEPPGSNVGVEGGGPGEGEDVAPTLTALDPNTAISGDAEDITLYVSGEGFTEDSVIVFGAYDEPTTLESDGTLSTGVKPSLFVVPDTVQVTVRNGTAVSGPLPFTFTDGAASDDPDELEDEIDDAVARGDVKQQAPKAKPKAKR